MIAVEGFAKGVGEEMASRGQGGVAFFCAHQTIVHIKQRVFQVDQAGVDDVAVGFCGRARLGNGGSMTGKRVAVDERMPGCSSLDLLETGEIAPFEAAIPMLELPQGRIRVTCVEDVAHFVESIHVELSYKRRDISVFEVLAAARHMSAGSHLCRQAETNARTLENSDVGDMTKLSFVLDHEIKCTMLGSSSILR